MKASPMTSSDFVQIISASVFPFVVIGLMINRWSLGRGIGVRSIQFVVAAMIVPAVVILAIRGLIGGETSAALIGAFIGYLFANVANFDKSE